MIRVVEYWVPERERERKCPVCRRFMRRGQTVVYVNRSTQFHRRCLSEFLDASFDQVPLQPQEFEDHELFPRTMTELQAAKERRDREKFEAYRLEVARRLGVASSETEHEDPQLIGAVAVMSAGDMS